MVTADIIGWIGTACLVAGYGIVSTRGTAPGFLYQSLNLLGAMGLVVNGAYHGAWPSVGLNVMWLIIGGVGTTRLLLRRGRLAAGSEQVVRAPDAREN